MSDKASEFITLMNTVKELLNDSSSQANMAQGIGDEAAELFAQGGNATSHSAMTQAAESARKLVDSAAGLVTIADEAITQAQQAQGNLLGSSSAGSNSAPFKVEVVAVPSQPVSPSNREPVAKTGGPIQPPQGGPDDVASFRLELTPTDDQDESKARMNKFGRAAVRKTGGLDKQAKDTTDSLIGQIEARGTVETVGVPPEQGHEEIRPADAGVPVTDIVSNAVLYTVFAVEGLSRLGNREKRGK